MDSALHLQVASRAYRTSFVSLGVIIVFSALLLPVGSPAALAAALGGLVAWLPHVYMIARVFGRGRTTSVGGLLAAEAIKFILTGGLFAIAFALIRAEHAKLLLLGFVVAVVANLAATAVLSRQLDNHWSPSATPDTSSE